MKILVVAPYIYKKEWKEFTVNPTGFGMMVLTIYEAFERAEKDSFLLTQVITKGHGNVIKHTWADVISNSRPSDWKRGIEYFVRYRQDFKNRCKYFYYGLNAGTLRSAIKKIDPDVVHIHGLGMQGKPYIDICSKMKIPYVITLHGLIGLDETVGAPEWDKSLERSFLIEADKQKIPVTVISSGMKKRIEDSYLHHEANNITVVCNGIQIDPSTCLGDESDQKIDLRMQYGIDNDCKVVVAIGSLCERKNQKQIINAIATGAVKTPCHVFLCGRDHTGGEIQKLISEKRLENRIHLLGLISHEKIADLLEQADLNVLASRDEGFGLSIIEAYSHGVPTVTFEDLDAVEDLFDENAMIRVQRRNDNDLGEAIEEALSKSWDKNKIKELAGRFSLEKMVREYEAQYRKALSWGGYMPIAKTLDVLSIKRTLGRRVVTYVGNITDNKNQMALAEAMRSINDGTTALLVGREADGGRVRRTIREHHLEEKVLLAGFCDVMSDVWEATDVNVFLSKNDGFGLPVIEGYVRGIPCILNRELDAYEDIYSTETCISVDLEESTIAKAVKRSADIKWDSSKIRRFGNQFLIDNTVNEYINVFSKQIRVKEKSK